MRVRCTALACALSALACAAAPAVAAGHPARDRGLTLQAIPHRISAGEGVLIFGRLRGANRADKLIRLYHRVDPAPFYTLIGVTRTNPLGEYEFTRADGLVMTNRNWYVRGPGVTHSRTVHERVAALVSLSAGSTGGLTSHPIAFTGQVTPDHAGGLIVLQQQRGSTDAWRAIARARIDPGSTFSISHAWRTPGAHAIRAVFRGDARNTTAPSNPVSVVIQRSEVPDFTIQTSDAVVPNGQPVTISGTLYQPGTTTPESSTSVALYEAAPGSRSFAEVTATTTAPDGTYSFTGVSSTTNERYQVRTMFSPLRHSAVLFEGVQDVVTMQAGSSVSSVDGRVTFTGTVSPGKAGHAIYLQRRGADGDWHTVEIRFVTAASTFRMRWRFGTAGTKVFRARITGGPVNVGGASTPVTIDVALPPLTSLPTG